MFSEPMSTALHSLRINVLRSILSILGVVVAISIVIILISMGSGVRGEIVSQIESLGSNLLILRPGAEEADEDGDSSGVTSTQLSLSTLTEDDAKTVRSLPSVSLCSGTTEGPAQVSGPDGVNMNSKVIGVGQDFWKIRDVKIEAGEPVTGGTGNCVIGSYVSKKLFAGKEEGGLGDVLNMGESSFNVTGVAGKRPVSMISNPNRELYVSLEDARGLLGGSGLQVSQISAEVADGEDIELVKKEIEKTIKEAHNDQADFTVVSQEDLVSSYSKILSLLNALVIGIAGAALVVGGIGIANVMYISVRERTSEIGVRMAQGANKGNILRQFILESTILCVIGGVVGVPLGIIVSRFIDNHSVMSCSTPLWAIVMALVAAVVTGVIAGVFPAIQAVRIDIGDALRKE